MSLHQIEHFAVEFWEVWLTQSLQYGQTETSPPTPGIFNASYKSSFQIMKFSDIKYKYYPVSYTGSFFLIWNLPLHPPKGCQGASVAKKVKSSLQEDKKWKSESEKQEDKSYWEKERKITFKVESLAPAVRCLPPAPPTPPIAFSEIFWVKKLIRKKRLCELTVVEGEPHNRLFWWKCTLPAETRNVGTIFPFPTEDDQYSIWRLRAPSDTTEIKVSIGFCRFHDRPAPNMYNCASSNMYIAMMPFDVKSSQGGFFEGAPLCAKLHFNKLFHWFGTHSQPKYIKILVESRSWRDRNLKFGPNCDLEVENLEKN